MTILLLSSTENKFHYIKYQFKLLLKMIKKPHTFLRWSLLGGAIYFMLIAIAHVFGIKIPLLFIYYNLPSYIYQDIIIAFLAFGWGMFFYSGYKSSSENQLVNVKYIIIAGYCSILGLIYINSSTNFTALMVKAKASHFWVETILLFLYPVWLTILYWFANKKTIDTKSPFMKNAEPSRRISEQEEYARKWR